MELDQLQIIDWAQAKKQAGNNEELANDILNMFIKTLPQELTAIKNSHQTSDRKSLLNHVHKLHGAICYCGLPRLKTVVMQLEMDLKQNKQENIDELVTLLEQEAQAILATVAST